MEGLRKDFMSVGFKGSFSLGLLDPRHVLIRFDLEDDFHRCWLRGFWTFQGFAMRVFKWSPTFSANIESSIVPVWIRLPFLPVHLFGKEPLFSIARLVGEPLRLDASTATLSRPSVARICVEVDLLQSLPQRVWIWNGSTGFWQKVEYESLPDYCESCRKLGHSASSCRSQDHVVNHRDILATQQQVGPAKDSIPLEATDQPKEPELTVARVSAEVVHPDTGDQGSAQQHVSNADTQGRHNLAAQPQRSTDAIAEAAAACSAHLVSATVVSNPKGTEVLPCPVPSESPKPSAFPPVLNKPLPCDIRMINAFGDADGKPLTHFRM
ncbi:uncharacterized protein LOC113755505 [Coffea eugenioides]|uniref:uncharacterized protein LOC113755505 n=1 Tax=Coffea eugenioides TaxID=49369 RepID=UPI000F604713|nr:uncharacterized protein LOC113755505 [Coffea eugenioides]